MYHYATTDSDEEEDEEEDAELGITLGTNQPERELALHIAQTMRDLAQVCMCVLYFVCHYVCATHFFGPVCYSVLTFYHTCGCCSQFDPPPHIKNPFHRACSRRG